MQAHSHAGFSAHTLHRIKPEILQHCYWLCTKSMCRAHLSQTMRTQYAAQHQQTNRTSVDDVRTGKRHNAHKHVFV